MSDQDKNVFNNSNTKESAGDPSNKELSQDVNSVFADQLAAIRNDQGAQKYNSIQDALEGAKHAQDFIKQLKDEKANAEARLKELESELSKRASVEDVVQKLSATKKVAGQGGAEESALLDEGKVLELVQTALHTTKQSETYAANERKVSEAISKVYGEKALEMVAKQAQELGLSIEELQQMSRKSPAAVLKIFGVTEGSKSKGSVGSSSIVPPTPKPKTLEAPTKSLLRGGSAKDRADFYAQAKEATFKRLGIDT